MKLASPSSRRHQGYSLVEMIMCITVIAIMAGIAVSCLPNASTIEQAKDQRNAQSFCTLFSSASAAGVKLVTEGSNKIDVLRALKDGVTVETGPFRGRKFALPHLEESDLNAAGRFIELRDGQMIYRSTGV